MTDEEKLYQAYYQPDRLWAGGKAIKELHKMTSISRKDIKSWLAKQALWQVHIPPLKEIRHPYYDITNLMSNISLIWLICLMMFLKERRTSIFCLALILHHDIESPSPL